MLELTITDKTERELVVRALITHVFDCRKTIRLHEETKKALGDAAIVHVAAQAQSDVQTALVMLAKHFDLHLVNSKFYCLKCAPISGEEHDRMSEAPFARSAQCRECGNGAYYFVEPHV